MVPFMLRICLKRSTYKHSGKRVETFVVRGIVLLAESAGDHALRR